MSHAPPAARLFFLLLLILLTGCAGARVQVAGTASTAEVSPSDVAAGDVLFAIVQAGQWGYMNRQGEVVIPPRFDAAAPFSEGRAAVRIGTTWGYITPNGSWIVEPTYASAVGFSEGRALVSRGRGKAERFGFIDASGVEVIETEIPYALGYSEGLALVRLTEIIPTPVEAFMASLRGRKSAYGYAFMDLEGRVVFEVPGISAASFSGGLAPFEESQGLFRSSTWGYLDREGNIAVSPTLDGPAFRHTERLARVGKEGQIGFVDTGGEFVIEPDYTLAFAFSEGLAPVSVDGTWGFVNASGDLAIAPQFRAALPFSDGLAAVQTASGWGYTDASGDLAVRATYSRAESFARGLARVYEGRLLRYINASGETVWAQQ